jgi:hypothetical protein
MLCCAWTKGPELPKLVVGSSAGWVVVVDCEGEEMEDALVSEAESTLCMCVFSAGAPRSSLRIPTALEGWSAYVLAAAFGTNNTGCSSTSEMVLLLWERR